MLNVQVEELWVGFYVGLVVGKELGQGGGFFGRLRGGGYCLGALWWGGIGGWTGESYHALVGE